MVRVRDVLKVITYLCVATAYAAVMPYVGVYYSVGFAVMMASSIFLDYRRVIEIPRWALNTVSVLVLVISCFRVTPEYLVEPVLDALLILVAIKLHEDKKFRDYMQIFAMCMFLLMGSTFISLSMVFLIYFSILATLSTISLILLAYFSRGPDMLIQRESLVRIFYQALFICSLSLPASALFFIILPRTNYPLLSFLNQSGYARSGFSDKVVLGEVSDIQEDNSVILRAEMPRIDESKLYWRGIVLDVFDGLQWKSSQEAPEGRPPEAPGQVIAQTIYLEPYGDRYLFALDTPVSVSLSRKKYGGMYFQNPVRHNGLTYFTKGLVNERIRYNATSVVSDFIPEAQTDRDRYLQLPLDFAPRIRDLVEQRVVPGNEAETVRALLKLVKWGDYRYSLESLPVSPTPLEDFLFVNRSGNCEYFASALAVMLRMAGVPARLVGGYKGGFFNNTGNYYLVLQKHAHVWVEAYLAPGGWARLDPTPYTQEAPAAAYEKSVFLQLKLLLDAFNYYWFKLIINYDFSRQLAILSAIRSTVSKPNIRAHWEGIQWKRYALYAPVLLAPFLLIFCALRFRGKSREQKLLAQFQKKMERHGYARKESEGLEEFLSRIDRSEIQDRAGSFVSEFEGLFYRDRKLSKEDIKHLESKLKML